jgi:hypothetical protein
MKKEKIKREINKEKECVYVERSLVISFNTTFYLFIFICLFIFLGFFSLFYCLGLLIWNSGYGTAFNMSMTSSQPEIIDNKKGYCSFILFIYYFTLMYIILFIVMYYFLIYVFMLCVFFCVLIN